MNFPFALWLIGLETGMGTIPAFCKRNIFSSTSGKGFLAQKKKKNPSSFAGCGRVLSVKSGDVAAIL